MGIDATKKVYTSYIVTLLLFFQWIRICLVVSSAIYSDYIMSQNSANTFISSSNVGKKRGWIWYFDGIFSPFSGVGDIGSTTTYDALSSLTSYFLPVSVVNRMGFSKSLRFMTVLNLCIGPANETSAALESIPPPKSSALLYSTIDFS